MRIESIPQLWANPLVADYLQLNRPVHSLFSYHPLQKESFIQRAAKRNVAKDQELRSSLVEVLRSFHDPELLHPAVEENLARLNQPDSLVVIGGQQAGLLTGPLYTLYKAVTIIQLARREEERLQRSVIPVFWIAGEDHDRDEVDHIWVQDHEGKPVKYRYKSDDREKRPVSSLLLPKEELHQWIDQLSQLLPDREYKHEWVEQLKSFADESISWVRFFARVMHHLFGKWGLLLIDSADPRLRRLEAPFFQQLIRQSETIQERVLTAIAQLEEMGYKNPVEVRPGQANLFVEVEGERLPLLRQGGEWMTREKEATFTTEQLLEIAEKNPERLSNNVLTRPLMQEYLFPTLAFVGGPGEIAYWSLLKQGFAEVGLEMPIIYPRVQMTLLHRTAEKRMREFALSWEDLVTSLEKKKADWLNQQHQLDVEGLFAQVKKQIAQSYQPLLRLLDQEIGMDLREMGRKNLQKLNEQVDFFYSYTNRAIQSKFETGLRHWDELSHTCLPEHKPQERVYNVINYWNQYGLSWLDQLIDAPLLTKSEEDKHRWIIL